jgi:hypothetical protein
VHASLLVGLPIAVWALVLLGYALVRAHRDRVEHHDFQKRLKAGPGES